MVAPCGRTDRIAPTPAPPSERAGRPSSKARRAARTLQKMDAAGVRPSRSAGGARSGEGAILTESNSHTRAAAERLAGVAVRSRQHAARCQPRRVRRAARRDGRLRRRPPRRRHRRGGPAARELLASLRRDAARPGPPPRRSRRALPGTDAPAARPRTASAHERARPRRARAPARPQVHRHQRATRVCDARPLDLAPAAPRRRRHHD